MRESVVEKHLCNRVKRLGGEVRKVKWIGRSNAPDRLVLLTFVAAFVELKRPGERPTKAQAREHQRLRRCGLRVEWFDTPEGIDRWLKVWGV